MDKQLLEQLFKGIVPGLSKVLEDPQYSRSLVLRLRQIFANDKTEGVSIITCTNRPHFMNNIFANYENQFHAIKELIIILNRDDMDLDVWKMKAENYPNVSIYKVPQDKTIGECQNFAVEKTKYEYIATFDDDDYYAPNYISDLMLAFKYTDADIVGKSSYFCYIQGLQALVLRNPANEFQYVDFVGGGKRIVKKSVFDVVKFPPLSNQEDRIFCIESIKKGFKIFSADNYNLCYLRSSNQNHHTWSISDEEMLARCSLVTYTNDYKPFVTL
ncbi:glycosyltransferase family 2 protein [Bacillus sp. Marseille-P3661]|uniref:glycosyltransferase family 2 protein n=1 Tax=Bacillus sp. Marseille-P3661 TaxID=1936234 RepID=UPI000C832C1A|nr:glycosyltransferase family A protein [Bacillus sp. Marseille-P3661]